MQTLDGSQCCRVQTDRWCVHTYRVARGFEVVPPPPLCPSPTISLWDIGFGANTERFQGLVPLWSHLCLLSVL